MEAWIIFVIIYGLLRGAREPIKKGVLQRVDKTSALFAYTLIVFLLSAPFAKSAFDVSFYWLLVIVIKSAIIFVGWLISFTAIKNLPVSVYGITTMSGLIFSTLMGKIFFAESITLKGVISLLLVITGIVLTNTKSGVKKESYKLRYVWLTIFFSLLNSTSGALDKYIMASGEVSSSVLQFWFMLLLSVFYLAWIIIKKEGKGIKKAFCEPGIYLIALFLFVGDKLLFEANSDPNAKITVMTVIKQSSAVVTILLGRFLYKEKNIIRKLACAAIIIFGIALSAT